jgi:hypothetical protein
MKLNYSQIIISLLFVLFNFSTKAQLGIKETNTPPNSKAMLDVESPNKGILIPRMNTAARDGIASPPDGLMIYNNQTKKFNYFDNTAWQEAFFGNQWAISDNNISYSGGNVGIGIANPNRQLVINGGTSALLSFYQGAFTGTTTNDGLLFGSNTAVEGILWNYENAGLRFATNNLERFTILSNGNVGIGDTSPGEKLDVSGNINLTGKIKRPATGSANMLPIAYGTIQDNDNILSDSNNWTLSHVDNSGIYDITVTGETIALTGYTLMATSNANFPVFVVALPVSGKLQVKTFLANGTLQDTGFSFVIYKP